MPAEFARRRPQRVPPLQTRATLRLEVGLPDPDV